MWAGFAGGPARRPGHRHLARRRGLRPSQHGALRHPRGAHRATASAPRCTSRRTCPNYGRPGRGPKLERGLALAVEPMVTLGSKHTGVLEDDWTIVTDDGVMGRALRAHASRSPRTVAWILTALDGGEPSWPSSACRSGGGLTLVDPARSCCSPSGRKSCPPTTSTTRSAGDRARRAPTCPASTWRTPSCRRSTLGSRPASSSAAAR